MKAWTTTVWRLTVAALALLAAGCASVTVPRAPEVAVREDTLALTPREAANLRVFDTAWGLVQRKFYDPKLRGVDWSAAALTYGPKALAAADDEQLYGAVNAMLGELKESHNHASTPKELAEKPGRPKARIGIATAWIEGRWMILDVLPGSPAEAAGVQRGWIFASRNGRTLVAGDKFSVEDGETVVDVYLDQQDKAHTLTMTAEMLSTDVWRHEREMDGGVVYLRFDGFDRASRRWLSERLKEHRNAPAVIVDLRQNPGGSAFSLGITVGEFFQREVGWGRFIGRSGRPRDNESWQWGSARYEGKVAVLVDGSTASCAEIFARVLQYHRRAVVVGRPTAGAVIGSFSYRLPDGGKLQLGAFDYQGPDGQRLEGVGVKPDILVPSVFDGIGGLRANRDLDLEAALAALKTEIARLPRSSRDVVRDF